MAADFYLPSETTEEDKKSRIVKIIQQLGLVKCQNNLVGSARMRGISGGEKKRLNIAVEIISNPSILFLDEPTTGLDSFQALSVVLALKNLVK